VQNFLDYRRYLPYLLFAVLALLAIGYRFAGGTAAKKETSYLVAENYFTNLQQAVGTGIGIETIENYLDKLKEITTAYPSLQSRYDGTIAQFLIAMGRYEEAQPFAMRTLKRTAQDQLPIFNDFSKISLMIAKGNLAEALEEAQKLKKEMIQIRNKNEGSFVSLFAYTLLRNAILQSKAGAPRKAEKAWTEWEKYASSIGNPQLRDAVAKLEIALNEGKFTLNDYISLRGCL